MLRAIREKRLVWPALAAIAGLALLIVLRLDEVALRGRDEPVQAPPRRPAKLRTDPDLNAA